MGIEVGQTVGGYQVVALLGRGGMGKVFRVRNVISDRIEAMKVLLDDMTATPDLSERFLREIKVVASLEHPNIAALRTAFKVDDQLVMIMELVEGSAPVPVYAAPSPAVPLASDSVETAPTPAAPAEAESLGASRPVKSLGEPDLERLKKELAVYIGPMARIIVARAAKRSASLRQLYETVAAEIPSPADRQKFLASHVF